MNGDHDDRPTPVCEVLGLLALVAAFLGALLGVLIGPWAFTWLGGLLAWQGYRLVRSLRADRETTC